MTRTTKRNALMTFVSIFFIALSASVFVNLTKGGEVVACAEPLRPYTYKEATLTSVDKAMGAGDPLLSATSLTEEQKKNKTQAEISALEQDKRNNVPTSQGPFAFRQGASLNTQELRIGFIVEMPRNALTYGIADNSVKGSAFGDFVRYKFYLVRENYNDKELDVSVTTFVFNNSAKTSYRQTAIIDKDKYDDSDDFIDVRTRTHSQGGGAYALEWNHETPDELAEIEEQGYDPFGREYNDTLAEGEQIYFLRLFFNLNGLGVYNQYRVYFAYERLPIVAIEENKDSFLWWSWGNGTYKPIFGEAETYLIRSADRSYYQVLSNMDNAGVFDSEADNYESSLTSSPMYSFWQELLESEESEISIEYLERIEGTPFAHRVSQNITMYNINVAGSTLFPDDVASALGQDHIVFDASPVELFQYDSERRSYVAKYYNTVNLKTVTTEGRTYQYYLNPNKSFREFYFPFITSDEESVITLDCYNYMFGALKQQYPQLSTYQDSDIYGFWGYAVLPSTKLISDIIATIQNRETQFNGVYRHFSFTGTLSFDAYNRLLNSYGYGWLQVAWSAIVNGVAAGGSFEATHYFVYADGTYTQASIDDTGSTDVNNEDSVLNDEIHKAAGVANSTMTFIRNLGEKTGKTVLDNVPTLFVLAIIVGLVYFYLKFRPTFAGSKKTGTRSARSHNSRRGKKK